MKKSHLFALVTILASFIACNNETEETLSKECEIKLTSEITPASRVTSLEYQSTQIVSGQQVGVTIKNAKSIHNNIAWTAGADGTLTNTGETVYYGNQAADITTYHPYNAGWTETSHAFSVNTDQSTNEGYLASDLLWATASATKTESPVALTFTHKLAKINVALTSTDITDLSDATISICGTNIATNFNPQTGDLSAATTANIQEIKAGVTTTGIYTASAIVVPQSVANGTKLIKVSHGTKTFYYTLAADKELKSGYSHNFTLTVKEREIELKLKSENITDWENNEEENVTGNAEEEVKTLLLPDGETFNQKVKNILANNTSLKKIKFITNSETTSDTKLVTDEDGTIGYIVENEEYLEIHSSVQEFIANSNCKTMFSFSNIVSIDFGENFKTTNVTDMSQMFLDCSALTSLDLKSFDTSNVTDMSLMFDYCSALTSLDISGFNTSNVTDMRYMFDTCTALTSLDLSSFSFGNNVTVTNMFLFIGMDASNKPISIKVREQGYNYLKTKDCNIGNDAKFVKPDGTDWD